MTDSTTPRTRMTHGYRRRIGPVRPRTDAAVESVI